MYVQNENYGQSPNLLRSKPRQPFSDPLPRPLLNVTARNKEGLLGICC